MFTTFDVLKLLTSRLCNLKHLLNILSMSTTFEVLKFFRFRFCSSSHDMNIKAMFVTLAVLNLLTSMTGNFLQS